MKVAVFLEKQSPMFGQLAPSHTVRRFSLRRSFLILNTSGKSGDFTFGFNYSP
jgi:hypothetical protein